MGVVVRRYIDILRIFNKFPYSTCISSFLGRSIPTSLFILKMFFHSQYISKRYSRTFEIVQKNRDHANIII